jgi:hypothetical protein
MAAGYEEIWVAIVPDTPEAETQIQLYASKLKLKVNICKADRETILATLLHCRKQLGVTFDIAIATERISKASGRLGWKNLQPVAKLQCGLSAAKIKVLEEFFEAIPEKIEIKPAILNFASENEILEALEAASTLPETKLSGVDIKTLAHSITNSPERQYWQDLKPLTKLKNGLTTARLAGLDPILRVKPAEPPTPNTVIYLLNLMSLTELKKEAKLRNISLPKKVSKSELVSLLSIS